MDNDRDRNPDRLLSEPPPDHFQTPVQQRDRSGSITVGSPQNHNSTGDDVVSPINGESTTILPPPPAQVDPHAKIVHEVVNSEIGVSTLLNRLKQSIASAKEFATFLKRRSTLEEDHANGLKKLCRQTAESNRRPEHRHGSFLHSYEEVTAMHERMAENGAQFAHSLHTMHDDLQDMAANIDRGRKHWKATGMAAEARMAETEAAMRKSKAKYDSLAEDYDRARTGDRQGSKKFGIKGPKSAAQHEEDLLRKVQAAESDYASKVQTAQGQRAELWSKLRPEAVKALQDLIKECDSALTLQMQKFASFTEKLLLSNGLNISPLKDNEQSGGTRSLREAVSAINNDQDLSSYLSSFASKVPARASEIKYERNAVLAPHTSTPPPQRQSDPAASFASRQGPPPSFGGPQQQQQQQSHPVYTQGPPQGPPPGQAPQHSNLHVHERSFSGGLPPPQFSTGSPGPLAGSPAPQSSQGGPPRGPPPSHGSYNTGSISSSGPPQLSTLPFQNAHTPPPQALPQTQPPPFASQYSQPPPPASAASGNLPPPLNPVFGVSLAELFERDGSAVPMVVYQCIQAVDLFGLDQEGIYRLSGTASHINKLKAIFDNDASKVDFRNPENFFHDVNSVAGLLKQFFRELPDPLLTTEHYNSLIDAAKQDDDTIRRDALHGIINSLPDPNYATLRAITLHLHRITENAPANRMISSNLAIVFGPTLMGNNTSQNIQDSGWQVRVVDTIIQNTYQIFDDD